MSTEQTSQASRLAIDTVRQPQTAQSQQWREIGISAVAAAAKQASERRETSTPAEPGKVVTLRDIDFLAA